VLPTAVNFFAVDGKALREPRAVAGGEDLAIDGRTMSADWPSARTGSSAQERDYA